MSVTLNPLNNQSEAYITMEYQLQQQLNAPRLKIIEAFDINNINQAADFGQFCESLQPLNVVHVFIPTANLQQPVSDIAKRGVRVNPKEGLVVQPDKIRLERQKEQHEVVHVLVALGNVLNYQHKVVDDLEFSDYLTDKPTVVNLPDDYDSLRLNVDGDFLIFKQEQLRTLHIIRFSGGDTLDLKHEFNDECDLCNNKATVYCENCKAKFCDSCDLKSHSQNRLLMQHNRVPIEDARTMVEECPFHPGHRVLHFCFLCQLPVCTECKMSGGHSVGVNSNHKLVPLKDAYSAALKHTDTEDRIYVRRKKALNDKRNEIVKRLQDVIENEKTVEARIMKVAEEAILELKKQSGERALKLRSTIDEIDRKVEECEAKSRFVKVHKELSNPVTFIRSSCIHDRVLQELKHDDDFPLDCAIEGDLCLTGGLHIMPKQYAHFPEGKNVRDIPFDEKERITDYLDSATTIPESTTTTNVETSLPSFDPSTLKVTKISASAARKMMKYQRQQIKIDFEPFAGSNIISPQEGEQLYHALPFKQAPKTHMLFSTIRDGRSIKTMHEMVDNLGTTCILIKKGNYIFGGFAGSKWNHNGKPFGEQKSTFIFSITNDAIIPYRPLVEDACVLFAEQDTFTFGKYDLVLAENFDHCVACIENSYSIGLPPDSKEAEVYLAGEPEFAAEIVECWGFFNDDQQ